MKDLLQNENSAAGPSACSGSDFVLKDVENFQVFGIFAYSKANPAVAAELKLWIFSFSQTKRFEFRKDGFSADLFPASSTAF